MTAPCPRPDSNSASTTEARRPTRRERSSGPTTFGPPGLGNGLLFAGAAVLLLRAVQDSAGLPFSMPRFWYNNGALWYAVALALIGGGIAILRERPPRAIGWRPTRGGVRFRTLIFYTRQNCPLCEEALDLLLDYARWLPVPDERDIDSDPLLVERFTNCVPVVELDGRVRFRGQINEVLLRRLIEATPPVDSGIPRPTL